VNLKLFLHNGVTSYLLGCVNVPTLSGTNGSAATINLLNSVSIPGLVLDAAGKNYIPFGMSQKPGLTDYADGVDTMKFLTELS
jgi:hypothetical protein